MAKKEITQGDMAKTEKKKGKKKGKKIMNLQIHIIVSFSTHLILLERFWLYDFNHILKNLQTINYNL